MGRVATMSRAGDTGTTSPRARVTPDRNRVAPGQERAPSHHTLSHSPCKRLRRDRDGGDGLVSKTFSSSVVGLITVRGAGPAPVVPGIVGRPGPLAGPGRRVLVVGQPPPLTPGLLAHPPVHSVPPDRGRRVVRRVTGHSGELSTDSPGLETASLTCIPYQVTERLLKSTNCSSFGLGI